MRPHVMHVAALVLCLAGASLAAVATGPALLNPDFPGQCWIPKKNRAFLPGTTWQEDHCVRAECISYLTKLYVSYAGCGRLAAGPGCELVQDLKLAYPSCCPTIVCREVPPLPEDYKSADYEEFTNWISEYYDSPLATA